jgi:hypothetical protein
VNDKLCAFCWLVGWYKLLVIMHGMNNIKCKFDVEHPSWRVCTTYIFQFLRGEISQDQHFSLLYSKLLSSIILNNAKKSVGRD